MTLRDSSEVRRVCEGDDGVAATWRETVAETLPPSCPTLGASRSAQVRRAHRAMSVRLGATDTGTAEASGPASMESLPMPRTTVSGARD